LEKYDDISKKIFQGDGDRMRHRDFDQLRRPAKISFVRIYRNFAQTIDKTPEMV
jgi:hypothetical protein